MDFWDLAKLMWRRWYVTVPMLLVTALAAVWTGINIAPDYLVTSHLAMVRSTLPEAVDEAEAAERAVNPWSSETLAEAAAIRFEGRALAEEMAAAGYEGTWSLGVTGRQPWLQLEVVAKTPEQAAATSARLREILEEEVRSRQDDYGIPPDEQVTMAWLDEGQTEEASTRSLRQALVAVVGAGLVLTTGVVAAFDAILRRRRKTAPRPVARAAVPRTHYFVRTDAPTADSGMPVAGTKPQTHAGARRANGVELDAPRPISSPPPGASAPREDRSEAAGVPVPDDATIVLPLAKPSRTDWPSEVPDGSGEPGRRDG